MPQSMAQYGKRQALGGKNAAYKYLYLYLGPPLGGKLPDLNPAKLSAGFRKKCRRPETTSGSKILKNKKVGSYTNPTLEPSRSHCPRPSSEWPKSRTITKYKQTCAQAKTSKKKPRSMWQGTPIFLQPCLYSFLQSGLFSMILMCLCVF